MKTCITCGMPLEGSHANDIAFETPDGPVCKHDGVDGVIKSPEEIFEGGMRFFVNEVTNNDLDLAARLTRRNMRSLPYWKKNPFALLDGPEATDEEYAAMMAKM